MNTTDKQFITEKLARLPLPEGAPPLTGWRFGQFVSPQRGVVGSQTVRWLGDYGGHVPVLFLTFNGLSQGLFTLN